MNIRSEQKKMRGLRFTALAVAFIFTATSVTWNTPANAATAEVIVAPVLSIDKLTIPAEMGTISRAYRGERGTPNGERFVSRFPLRVSRILRGRLV